MRIPSSRAHLYLFWCRLYIVLGLSSFGAGVYVWYLGHAMGKSAPSGILAIAVILIVFGLLRIANSVWVIRNISRRSQQAPPRNAATVSREQGG